jgi:hypothetical protein
MRQNAEVPDASERMLSAVALKPKDFIMMTKNNKYQNAHANERTDKLWLVCEIVAVWQEQ